MADCSCNNQFEGTPAIQDQYKPKFRHCFGCGADNEAGWHVKSYLTSSTTAVAHFTPKPEYTGGVPDNLYGGIIAAVMDCHGMAAGAGFHHVNDGLVLGQDPMIRCVTAQLSVSYKKPTPMGQELTLTATLEKIEGRKVWLDITVGVGNDVTAEGKILAVRVKE
ncbi:MAG: thioesterase [Bacteroidetes bacterium]|nr:MAG: thioesterase [Bacteroidota bacterium]